MAIDGNVDLDELNPGQETPFLLDGSLEPALLVPLALDLAATGEAGDVLNPYPPGLTLPALETSGGMADGMVLLAPTVDAQGQAGTYISGRVTLSLPQLAGSLEGPLTLAAVTGSGLGHAGQLLAADSLRLPVPQVAAVAGDFSILLPAVTVTAGAVAGTLASAAVTLAGPSLAATSIQDGEGAGRIQLATFGLVATGSATAVIDGSVTLDLAQLAATAGSGTVAEALLTVPLFDLAADAFAEAIGSATIALPAFALQATTISLGRPVTTAIVLNTRLKGVARYEGLQANSFAQFAGIQLAATPYGIVALMGDKDLGTPIAASLTAGTSDLGAPERKRIEAAYVGYRAGGEMEMTLIADEHHEYTYRLAPRQLGDMLHGARVKFGRGVDGRYWQWKLANTNGGAFELASLHLNILPLSRV